MNTIANANGRSILLAMVKAIQENKAYLGDIDGLIGDGDHGMNMNKGFTIFEKRIGDEDISFTEGLDKLGTILLSEIGGSMGPIYGTIFMAMAEAGEDLEEISLSDFTNMVEAGLTELSDIVEAKPGDKTLVDSLAPALVSLQQSGKAKESFSEAIAKMKIEAEKGRDSTKEMVAKYGRSARLGERSRGVLDAGATSCCLILCAMGDEMLKILELESR